MASFDIAIRATQARAGAQEFAQAGERVQRTARDAAAQVDKLDREIDTLGPRARRAGTDLGGFARQAGSTSTVLAGLRSSIGAYVGVFGAFRLASGAVREIAAFEKATVDASKAANIGAGDMGRFREELRKVALIRGIDQSAVDLANIAAIAGTLGVRGTENLSRFTEITAKLTSSLRGLSAEDVATGMGRILQITGEGAGNVEKFGNVFARLEDTVAGSASEILSASREVALATARYGISSTDVLGLGAAFTDLGIQSELSRSTLVRSLGAMSQALAVGGEDAETFAAITGHSVEELRQTLKRNAADAFVQLLRGIDRMNKEGKNSAESLRSVGLSGLRLDPVLQTLAERFRDVEETQRAAREESEKQVKLNQDLGKNADTLASRYANLQKRFDDIKLSAGENGLAGALKKLIGVGEDVLNVFDGQKADTLFGKIIQASGALAAAPQRVTSAVIETISPTYNPDDLANAGELYKQLNAEQLDYIKHVQEIIKAEDERRKSRDTVNSPEALASYAEIEKKALDEQTAAREKAHEQYKVILERQKSDRDAELQSVIEFQAELRKQTESAQAELSGADSAGLRGLALSQQIDEQTAALIRLRVPAAEAVRLSEESERLAAQIVDLLRQQEVQEQAVAAQKKESADAAHEKARAEREATQELERQRREQERALESVARLQQDARFEGSIAGLSQDDQARARELARFQEQANAAFGPGSQGATAAIEEFKQSLDFRDEQRKIRELSDSIAGDLTGSIHGLNDALSDGKITGQEFFGILQDTLSKIQDDLLQKTIIDPLTEQLSNGLTGALGGQSGSAADIASTVGTMDVQAGTVIVNGAGGVGGGGLSLGGNGGSGGIGGGGLDLSKLLGGGGAPVTNYQSASSLGVTSSSDPFGGVNVAQLGGVDALGGAGTVTAGAAPAAGGGLGGLSGLLGGAGGAGAALGGVGGALSLVGGLSSGNNAQTGSGIGQLLGLGLGILLPGIGTILGPLLGGLLGGAVGGSFAKGGVFGAGGLPVRRYAQGGVLGSPSYFQTPDGLASVAEVAEEGILPLGRNARGELGVKTAGGSRGGDTYVSHYNFPPGTTVGGFRKSRRLLDEDHERAVRRRRR